LQLGSRQAETILAFGGLSFLVHEIRAFRTLKKPAFVPEHVSRPDDILTANSGGITLYRVTA
jgi:hypothetical protein